MASVESDHLYILQSDNPDKEYEYFWMVFKKSIETLVSPKMKAIIDEYSDVLNKMQKKKEYTKILEKIKEFIDEYLDTVALYVIAYGSSVNFMRFKTNVYRWKKIDTGDDVTDCLEINIVITLANYCKKMDRKYEIIMPLFKDYALKCLDPKISNEDEAMYIAQIFEFALKNKLGTIVCLLKDYVDLTPYIKPGVSMARYANARSHKLLQILCAD